MSSRPVITGGLLGDAGNGAFSGISLSTAASSATVPPLSTYADKLWSFWADHLDGTCSPTGTTGVWNAATGAQLAVQVDHRAPRGGAGFSILHQGV